MKYYNRMAPFPVYDTDIVSDLEEHIKIMKREPSEYDKIPVTACKHCKETFILVDDLDNDICGRCGSINEIEIFKDIYEYLNSKDVDEDN
jgi:ribosomal protein S27AE